VTPDRFFKAAKTDNFGFGFLVRFLVLTEKTDENRGKRSNLHQSISMVA